MPGWFQLLDKPFWYTGPSFLTVLNHIWIPTYALVSLVFFVSVYYVVKKKWHWIVIIPFIINIGANFLFSFIIAGGTYVALLASFGDILVLFVSIVWAAFLLFSRSKILFYLLIPYILWALVVVVLQAELVRLNIIQ